MDRLIAALPGEPTLPPALRARLLLLGAAAAPALTAFVASWPGTGDRDHARGHAVDLLVHLRAKGSIPTLLRTIANFDCPDALYQHIYDGLPRFGAAVIEPALELLAGPTDREARSAVCDILCRLGVRDSRILQALLAYFAEDPSAADLLRDYGDPIVLPYLRDAIDRFAPDVSSLSSTGAITELVKAFEHFGGVLTDEQIVRTAFWYIQMQATLEAFREVSQARARYRAEHGAGCPCGSGRRYGDCCAVADSASFDEQVRHRLRPLPTLAVWIANVGRP